MNTGGTEGATAFEPLTATTRSNIVEIDFSHDILSSVLIVEYRVSQYQIQCPQMI